MRIVFDTNVLISASLWDNSVAHKLLIKLIKEDSELFTSVEILKEYKEAIIRDFKYSKKEVEEILSKLLNVLKITKPEVKIEEIKEDPADNKILECAISSNAEFILTYDNHLLCLKEFKGIKILKPEDFLSLI